MTTDTAVSEGKRDDPFDYIMDNVDGQHRCQRVTPKRQRLQTERQEDLKDLISYIRTISTDTWRWAQGPLIKQCLSPAQAPVQKQQQSQAACSSACLTRSEWWRHWVPYWKWLGSSGPQSRPAAWNRKTHTEQSGLKVLTVPGIRAPPSFPECAKDRSTRLTGSPHSDPYLRNSSALLAAEISVTPPLGTYEKVAYKWLGHDKFTGLPHTMKSVSCSVVSDSLRPHRL